MTDASPRFPRGSEWRRWDLHVHTPFSALNNGFGNDFEKYARVLFEKAVAARIAVLGITDYFTVEGYKRLRTLVDNEARLAGLLGEELAAEARKILLLPNIEFRTREVIQSPKGDKRVNFHILFSDGLAPKDIEDHFLHVLRFTAESEPGESDQTHPLTVANLEGLGRRIKEHQPGQQGSDLFVGMKMAVIDLEKVGDELNTRQRKRFQGRCLFVLPADEHVSRISWHGQGHHVRRLLIQKSHMFFSSNAKTRAFGLGQQHKRVEDFRAEFGPLKPCVHGSDAHRFEDLFVFAEDRDLWIRADPTFDGLLQLLHEPEHRVHLGLRPPGEERRKAHATKYLDSIHFERIADERPEERWFEGSVLLNPNLVAIIGRKGSGKSALADVIGLVGNAHSKSGFSFLNQSRFLAPKQRLGSLFSAELRWLSSESSHRPLDATPDPDLPELVEYLPQRYLEDVCTELQNSSSETSFDRELEAVVFSHVAPEERLGQGTLQDLIRFRTSEKNARIAGLRDELRKVNERVVILQTRRSSEFRRHLQGRLAQRQRELDAHAKAMPTRVADPSQNKPPDASDRTADTLASTVELIRRLDEQLESVSKRRDESNRQLAALERLSDRVENLRATVSRFYDESGDDSRLVGLDVTALVSLKTDVGLITRKREATLLRLQELAAETDPTNASSLVVTRAAESKRAESLRAQLDAPARRYEEYCRQLAVWKRERAAIVGSSQVPESLAGLEEQIAAVDAAPTELAQARSQRSELMRKIFAAKADLLADYERLHAPVQQFIASHPVAQEIDELEFSTSIAVDGLVDGLLTMIHKGRKGSFQGDQEGRKLLSSLIAQHDFSTADGVDDFLRSLGEHLTHDMRTEPPEKTVLSDQLVQSATPEAVYDFLFGLSYLRPRVALKWRDKPLDQLSPGERGTLLLIFYLLIDLRDCPLIIDQPEENLDNETIAELLVPAITYAKKRRQVIIVTHNPNLAVVCDAEQVIHASINKANGNAISYLSGSIEDPAITTRIVDVLEGTKPAFDLREAKYEVLERAAP